MLSGDYVHQRQIIKVFRKCSQSAGTYTIRFFHTPDHAQHPVQISGQRGLAQGIQNLIRPGRHHLLKPFVGKVHFRGTRRGFLGVNIINVQQHLDFFEQYFLAEGLAQEVIRAYFQG